ncbi:MAG: hypothetical protein VCC99_02440 [Alphaproteobacteria bacterium]
MHIKNIALAVLGATALASLAVSAQADPYHIRGELKGLEDGQLTVDTGDGDLTVSLNDDALIFVVDNGSIDDIKRDQFVGITSIQSGGDWIALEVHIFEESLRGLAAGHYPWDLVEAENMMTNANIGKLVAMGDDRHLTVSYVQDGDTLERKVGSHTIIVPPEATVVNFFAADRSNLINGETVFLIAVDTDDGTIVPAMVIGQNGVEPPM